MSTVPKDTTVTYFRTRLGGQNQGKVESVTFTNTPRQALTHISKIKRNPTNELWHIDVSSIVLNCPSLNHVSL